MSFSAEGLCQQYQWLLFICISTLKAKSLNYMSACSSLNDTSCLCVLLIRWYAATVFNVAKSLHFKTEVDFHWIKHMQRRQEFLFLSMSLFMPEKTEHEMKR